MSYEFRHDHNNNHYVAIRCRKRGGGYIGLNRPAFLTIPFWAGRPLFGCKMSRYHALPRLCPTFLPIIFDLGVKSCDNKANDAEDRLPTCLIILGHTSIRRRCIYVCMF